MSRFLTLDDLDVASKTVLVRLDLNVPMKDRKVADMTRIERSLATLRELKAKGAKTVIISHLGRPDGKITPAYSLAPVAMALGEAMNEPVRFAAETESGGIRKAVEGLKPGDILMLENIRFYPGEEMNDHELARSLASLADVYINDAFSVSHRAHASVAAITQYLPSAAGRLMQEELSALEKSLENPERPVMAIVGGAKVSTKVDLLRNLLEKVDVLVIGGGMANTFLLADGKDIGASFCDRESVPVALEILAEARDRGKEIFLPEDAEVAQKLAGDVPVYTESVTNIPAGMMILDIGPATVDQIKIRLAGVKTVVWNGPLGVFETPPFDRGTRQVAEAVAQLTREGKLLSVAGGGDTVAALNQSGVEAHFSYISAAGGAFLEWLEGKDLPGVTALVRAARAGESRQSAQI